MLPAMFAQSCKPAMLLSRQRAPPTMPRVAAASRRSPLLIRRYDAYAVLRNHTDILFCRRVPFMIHRYVALAPRHARRRRVAICR